jgi:hypothetical protein
LPNSTQPEELEPGSKTKQSTHKANVLNQCLFALGFLSLHNVIFPFTFELRRKYLLTSPVRVLYLLLKTHQHLTVLGHFPVGRRSCQSHHNPLVTNVPAIQEIRTGIQDGVQSHSSLLMELGFITHGAYSLPYALN